MKGSDRDGAPLVLDVFPLPTLPYQFKFLPKALVVARGPQESTARRLDVLRVIYGLTFAEIEIAGCLMQGQSARSIAVIRKVSVETVRTQIKAIMGKLGVRRQVELVIRLGKL